MYGDFIIDIIIIIIYLFICFRLALENWYIK